MSLIETRLRPAQRETIPQNVMNRIESEWRQMREAAAPAPRLDLVFRTPAKK
ncbi:hypothetical protein [Xaviernesmea oryzae]|uniref:hypothetical protein n=1 Tax=Xaviernesmea oryzae TaxID=464029 RepID=UPI0008B75122|nr:hypothetical protein [Xaviernesmea oryzae]SEL75591.1 hypothetical protein SAMN04487976_11268 [Xaviernesmea oryzae]